MKILAAFLCVAIACCSARLTENELAAEIQKQIENEDEYIFDDLNDKDYAPNIDLDELDTGDLPPDVAYGLRFRGRRFVERVVREVRRPIRQVREVVRRVIVEPVRRVVRRATGTLTRLTGIRTLRFRRTNGPIPTKAPPPVTAAPCREPVKRCPAFWKQFDKEELSDELFVAACQKYETCNACAVNRKWAHTSCLSRLLNDMKGMCAGYLTQKEPDAESHKICQERATSLHMLGSMQHKAVPASPAWCSDQCIEQRASPVVEISSA